jgi:hypothetical protein
MSHLRRKAERVGEIAAKAVVQLLFATGKSFIVDGLREKLREFFREEVRAELRAVAALSNVELITALLSSNRQLALVGLQLRISNGVVSPYHCGRPQQGFGPIFERTNSSNWKFSSQPQHLKCSPASPSSSG